MEDVSDQLKIIFTSNESSNECLGIRVCLGTAPPDAIASWGWYFCAKETLASNGWFACVREKIKIL